MSGGEPDRKKIAVLGILRKLRQVCQTCCGFVEDIDSCLLKSDAVVLTKPVIVNDPDN